MTTNPRFGESGMTMKNAGGKMSVERTERKGRPIWTVLVNGEFWSGYYADVLGEAEAEAEARCAMADWIATGTYVEA